MALVTCRRLNTAAEQKGLTQSVLCSELADMFSPTSPAFLPPPFPLLRERMCKKSVLSGEQTRTILECLRGRNGPLFCLLVTNYHAMERVMQPWQPGPRRAAGSVVCSTLGPWPWRCVRSNYRIQPRLASYYRLQALTPSSFTCSLIFKLSSSSRIFCKFRSCLQSSVWSREQIRQGRSRA